MEKFLIIDGNSIMNRAFYGLGSARLFSKQENIHTNALYGFLNTLWMIQEKISPNYIAVTFDLPSPTFRHQMYDEYKGTRKGMPEELAEQMPYIKKLLEAMNVPIYTKEGYEADDILGTVAKENSKNGILTYILTGDRDSYQLISNFTTIVMPNSKGKKTEYDLYTPELLLEKKNIEPYQVIEVKALMGDSADNIPGVYGIGEKTAYLLIDKYKNLDGVYEAITNEKIDVSENIKKKLISGKDSAYMSKKLATIDIDVPIDIDYNNAKVDKGVNKLELYKLFNKLNFAKFMEKYDFSEIINDSSIEDKVTINFEQLKSVNNIFIINDTNFQSYVEELKDVLNNDSKVSYILNITNKSNFLSHNVVCDKDILAVYSSNKNSIYLYSLKELNVNNLTWLFETFASSNVNKLGYNIKQDILYIFNNYNIDVCNFSFDIMIAEYLKDSSKSTYLIENIIKEDYNVSFLKYENSSENTMQMSIFDVFENKNSEKNYSKEILDNISLYLKFIYLSHDTIIEQLKDTDMLKLFNEIEMPLVETLASMEHTGMYIDKKKIDEFDIEITNKLQDLERKIYEIAGEEFNINSSQQLGDILFEKLGLPKSKKTKSGYSTNKEVLEELEDKHEIIPVILDYRQLSKLKSTYVDSLKERIDSDGRIHTTFMQTVASTGRLSSIEPNLQNIPTRTDIGKKIRSFFVGEDNNIIIDADYSQIELRVLAHISRDDAMIKAFENNIDVHKVTASQVFNVSLEEVTSKMRSDAKAVNFGIVYGISEFGLAKNIGCTRKEAAEYIENYLNKYSGIQDFMENVVMDAVNTGYVSTMFGRRRYIPEVNDTNKTTIQFGKRIAMNTPIQGTAADIIKLAMNKIYFKLKELKLKSKLVMQVHDELLIETVPDEIQKVKEIMYDAMENVILLKVPLVIDLNVGKSWFEAK